MPTSLVSGISIFCAIGQSQPQPQGKETSKALPICSAEQITKDAAISRAASSAVNISVNYAGFMRVREANRHDGTIWDETVSIFTSQRGMVYAWAVERGSQLKGVAIVRQPPIDSPLAAVQAWFAELSHDGQGLQPI